MNRLRLVMMDLILLLLQLTMLAINANTVPRTGALGGNASTSALDRVSMSQDLDRVERGEATNIGENTEQMALQESSSSGSDNGRSDNGGSSGYEHVTIRIGVIETIKLLWDNEAPIVRRFR